MRLSLAGVPRLHIADSNQTLAKVGALRAQAILEAQTRDGLAGDLALGLRDITGIKDARVIIAPATSGYFADEASHEASASVQIVREPGVELSRKPSAESKPSSRPEFQDWIRRGSRSSTIAGSR